MRHDSDSLEQREAEIVILGEVGRHLGVELERRRLELTAGVSVEVNGVFR